MKGRSVNPHRPLMLVFNRCQHIRGHRDAKADTFDIAAKLLTRLLIEILSHFVMMLKCR